MTKKTDYNPLTEIFDHNGKRFRLEKLLKVEVQAMSYDYLEKYGTVPTKDMMTNWMRRLKQAYHTGQITRME